MHEIDCDAFIQWWADKLDHNVRGDRPSGGVLENRVADVRGLLAFAHGAIIELRELPVRVEHRETSRLAVVA